MNRQTQKQSKDRDQRPPVAKSLSPLIAPFFDKSSSTFSYLVVDPESLECAVIDSVLNFDYASGEVSYEGANAIVDYVESQNLHVQWCLETHVHADHLSAAPYIQDKLGGKIGIGEHITTVQKTFGNIFNEGSDFARNGSQFDHLFADGEHFTIGTLACQAIHTPGHTPACMTYLVGDAAFVGDTLFMPDAGTARADFPGGSASVLFDSIGKILALDDKTRIFMCHDYRPNGRELEYQTSVAEQKLSNIHVKQGTEKSEFVDLREKRDRTLGMPTLILPSLQVNMRAGHFPLAEDNGIAYLKIPINGFKAP